MNDVPVDNDVVMAICSRAGEYIGIYWLLWLWNLVHGLDLCGLF